MKHRLLILGTLGEFEQLVQKAREKGYYTIVCDGYPDGPARKFADEAFQIPVTDTERIACLCREKEIDGILTSFSDLLLECMVKIADRAGIPCYLKPEQLPWYRDKSATRALLTELGLPTPGFRKIPIAYFKDRSKRTQLKELLEGLRYPVVSKPLDKYGSRGIYVVHNLEELKQAITEDEVIEQCQDAEIFIVQYAKITKKVMDNCPKLKYVVRYGVGVDTIDVPEATKHGIQVGNVPDYGMNEVADHAIALAMVMVREVVKMNQFTKNEKWDYTKAIPIHRFSELTVGVVGLGRIGRNFAKKMHALGFKVIGTDPYFKATPETDEYVTAVSVEDIITKSDIISLHCPADGNKDLFNAETFKKMKNSAVLINVARGGIINEADLDEALSNGEIAGAGLDCMLGEPVSKDSPLFKHENLVVTPHMAWYSEEAASELKRKVAEESVRFSNGEAIHYPINKLA